MQSSGKQRNEWRGWAEFAIQVTLGGVGVYALWQASKLSDPYAGKRGKVSRHAAYLKKELGLHRLHLDEFEELLLDRVVLPSGIKVQPEDVFGLDHVMKEMEDKVLSPMLLPSLYNTSLWRHARGVLLYGPPGTGKTMLAKAMAKRMSCTFLNITASSIMSKFVGDASRLVNATFTLARKLQPCIIFIDEVDALLAQRGLYGEHEASLQVKNEFMSLWDGMDSDRNTGVTVMAATNRPGVLDEAVLRRFALLFEVGLPDKSQRKAILRGYLRKHAADVPQGVAPELLRDEAPPDHQQAGRAERSGHDVIGQQEQGAVSGSDRQDAPAAPLVGSRSSSSSPPAGCPVCTICRLVGRWWPACWWPAPGWRALLWRWPAGVPPSSSSSLAAGDRPSSTTSPPAVAQSPSVISGTPAGGPPSGSNSLSYGSPRDSSSSSILPAGGPRNSSSGSSLGTGGTRSSSSNLPADAFSSSRSSRSIPADAQPSRSSVPADGLPNTISVPQARRWADCLRWWPLTKAPCSGSSSGGLDLIVQATEGFSGSDLLELCAQAAQQVLVEQLPEIRRCHMQQAASGEEPCPAVSTDIHHLLRPVGLQDLLDALDRVRPALHKARQYQKLQASTRR